VLCTSNIDWIAIDLEHNLFNPETIKRIIQVAAKYETKVFIRLWCLDEALIKLVLDAGASGLIVPMLKNKDELDKLINYVFYPPIGQRGVGISRAHGYSYGASFEEYINTVSNNIDLVVQIENKEAIDNIEYFAQCDKVSTLMIGPYDLSASYGSIGNFESVEFVEGIKKFKEITNKYNKIQGIHLIEPSQDKLDNLVAEGYKFIAYSTDFLLIRKSLEFIKNIH